MGLRTGQWGMRLPRLLNLKGMDPHPGSWAKSQSHTAQADPLEFIPF